MIVLPEINTLEDYEQMKQQTCLSDKNALDVHFLKEAVQIQLEEDSDGRFKDMKCAYNGHGIEINMADGRVIYKAFSKYQYLYTYSHVQKNNWIKMNKVGIFSFQDEGQKNNFLEFVYAYNAFMDKIYDAATEKMLSALNNNAANALYCPQESRQGIKKLIDLMGNSDNFTEEDIYFSLAHHFLTGDDLVNAYIKFSKEEREQGVQLLQDKTFKEVMEFLWRQVKRIQDTLEVFKRTEPDAYLNLFTYLLIRKEFIERYADIWEKEYNHMQSISQCLSQGILPEEDHRGTAALACWILKQQGNDRIDIISMIKNVKSVISGTNPNALDDFNPEKKRNNSQKNDSQTNAGQTSHYTGKDAPWPNKVSYNLREEGPQKNDSQTESSQKNLDELLEKLNSLVGLESVKNDVASLINLLQISKLREERGMKQIPMSLHLVFSGNPGTGKTTVARLLSEIYHKLGVLSKGHLIEVDRSGLVAGYVGQTAIKVQEVIQKALGGILFIDEAYSLTVNRGASDFGFEAVDTLLKGMEDHRDDLIVIVAGYPDSMNEFLESNPGLRSRFNRFLTFEDYTPQELVAMFEISCRSMGYTASRECMNCVKEYFEQRYRTRDKNFANGREVRNYFEMAMVNQANRLSKISDINDEMLTKLELEDVQNISV